jgi:hypothetical protein
MQHNPYHGGMNSTIEQDQPEAAANPTLTLFEALVRRRCVSVTYNRKRMILAPHILYTRRDALYMDAVTVSLEGMLPREVKLGTFKADGLSEVKLVERGFEINPIFEPEAEKYQGVTMMKVEPEGADA